MTAYELHRALWNHVGRYGVRKAYDTQTGYAQAYAHTTTLTNAGRITVQRMLMTSGHRVFTRRSWLGIVRSAMTAVCLTCAMQNNHD